jgi:protein-tyrosine phosphatase
MSFSILTVCTGNICRSPLAAFELRRQLPGDFSIQSAGLAAVVGAPAEETVHRIAENRGLDLSDHVGTQLDDRMVRENDLILVMTSAHKDEIEQTYSEAMDKVFLLGHWGAGEVPDPYGGPEALYLAVDRQIQEAVRQWLPRLKKINMTGPQV